MSLLLLYYYCYSHIIIAHNLSHTHFAVVYFRFFPIFQTLHTHTFAHAHTHTHTHTYIHTSYIIHHTSYIIHHTSYIIHHTSYIIHHTSYIIPAHATHASRQYDHDRTDLCIWSRSQIQTCLRRAVCVCVCVCVCMCVICV